IVASPSGTAYGATVAGGFVNNVTDVHNITASNTTLTGTEANMPLDIFGVVGGRVWDNNTVNESLNLSWPAYGLPYASFTVLELGNNTGSVGYQTDGGGFWAAFLPGNNGPNATHVLTYCKPAFTSASYVVQAPLRDGYSPADAGNSTLERFGWVDLQFLSTGTGLPVAGAAANAEYTNPKSGASYSDHATSNEAGYLNLSSPYGADVLVQVTAPDFNSTNFTVLEVNSSQTTFPNSTTVGVLGSYYLPAYGWVLASQVNFSDGNPPPLTEYPLPTIVDSVNGLGVPNAQVQVTSPDISVPGGGSQPSNWDGQFYSDAPIGPTDGFTVTHPGYLTNTTNIAVKSGSYRWVPIVNLTGEAVVAGRVTSNPSNIPIPGATVQLCGTVKNQGICSTATTNISGIYWVVGPPGSLTLTVSQTAYVSSTSQVQACSDCWSWAGTVELNEYGTVTGNVRGLPSGFPVDGANVSLCSTLGTPTGPCGPAVGTNQYGHFVISAPPGSYILAVNDTNYNSTFLPVALSPGETTSVGTLFLSQFGTDVGTVYDGSKFTPLAGAEVLACAVFSEGTCAPAQTTNSHGQYAFSAAPGTYTLTVSAGGYVTAYSQAVVSAGITTTISTIPLQPLGSDVPLPVSGTVSDALSSAPIVGATVAALVNGSIAASTETQAGGVFSLSLPYGTYDLLATYYGYAPVYRNQTEVHQAMANLAFELSPMTYVVSGQVVDALTHQPLPNSIISTALPIQGGYTNGTLLATSDQGGEYSMRLTNGTHDLYLQSAAGSPIAYASQEFQVVVNGVPQTRDLSMTPALSQLDGRVVDAATGLPLTGATVKVVGQVDGVKYLRTFTTGSDGTFSAQLYVGVYTASTSYGAYQATQKTFTVAVATTTVTLALSPLPTPVTGTVSTVPAWAIWGAVGVSIAAVAGAIVLAGRPTQRSLTPGGAARTAAPARRP
ncbi:MAG TPA: carboxypeptidase regulatory-like domain-containing protein, partial [Thermoplasmata archaeon]|nr:carboxypeptidase regulatory-like domain-containing protein [Thermoplasmata archaeon]